MEADVGEKRSEGDERGWESAYDDNIDETVNEEDREAGAFETKGVETKGERTQSGELFDSVSAAGVERSQNFQFHEGRRSLDLGKGRKR